MARIEIMSGTERRRRWSDEAKLRILAEADEPGARIGDVPSGNVRVYLACGVTDMRRGIDGLSALVETVVKEAPGFGRNLWLPRKAR
ncbi:IS66 family insertion sequence element accessory protein TnpB [Rhizobium sp. YTU87027]|uniref:IS66 family insertion sequence element accessory protein TnpB n=1 Tax=Rhizobium TaxID=379 RepID=UPI003D6866DD